MDREKIIDGLRHCLPETIIDGLQDCNTCPYQHYCETDATVSMPIRMIEDIRSLLKEQETKIRQLRLALDIVKGTCKGIAVETDEKFMGDL